MPADSRTAIIHIGSAKTGTSAIQKFVQVNEAALAHRGFFVPMTGRAIKARTAAHHDLAVCLYARKDKKKARSLWTTVREEIDSAPQPNVLISSEAFLNCANPDLLQSVTDALTGLSVRVILYLRRADDFCQALYVQHIRSANCVQSFQEFRSQLNPESLRSAIRTWGDAWGQEKMIVRPYERCQWLDGDLIKDFLHCLGIAYGEDFQDAPYAAVWTSLDPICMEVMRVANRVFAGDALALQRIRKQLTEMNSRRGFGGHDFLPPADRLEIIRQYEPVYSEVARTCLGRKDGQLFRGPLPAEVGKCGPYESLSRFSRLMGRRDEQVSARLQQEAIEPYLEAALALVKALQPAVGGEEQARRERAAVSAPSTSHQSGSPPFGSPELSGDVLTASTLRKTG